MKIKSIKISNFKGLKRFHTSFNQVTNIVGTNGVGKSTIMDAFLWCLTGKNSEGKEEFKITPQDEKGNNIENLENDVTVVVDDIPYRTVRTEKWTKRRGESFKSLTGYEYEYLIDGVPKSKSDYRSTLSTVLNPDNFQLLSNPLHFAKMHWKDQRSALVGIANIKSDTEIAKELVSESKFMNQVLWLISKGMSIEDQKLKLQRQIKELEKKPDDIRTRIDQNERMKPDPINVTEINSNIVKLEQELKSIEDAGKSIFAEYSQQREENQKKKDQLTQLNTKLFSVERCIRENFDTSNLPLIKKRSKLSQTKTQTDILINEIRDQKVNLKSKLSTLKSEYDTAVKLWDENEASEFKLDEKETICPTCKRQYDDSDSIRVTMEENFNENKAKRRSQITEMGSKAKLGIESIENQIKEAEDRIPKLESKLLNLQNEIEEIEIPTQESIDFGKYPDWVGIKEQIEKIENSIIEPELKTDQDTENRKSEIKAQISDFQKSLGVIGQIEKYDADNNALKKELADISSQVVSIEGEIDAIQKFQRRKMSIVEESVNSMFEVAKFRLWEEHINGNDKETCVLLYNGVPFSDASTAQKTMVGLDIIKTFQKHYGVELPLFIDNRESIVQIPDMPNQIINMIVDKNVETLTVE